MSEHTQSESTLSERTLSERTVSENVASPTGRTPRSVGQWVVVVVMAVLVALIVGNVVTSRARATTEFPQSSAMESALGVRFSRVAVVADGGLITVSYVVLDSDKASRFQSDRDHPPVLTSESRDASTKRVSLMKQGHSLRAGQTYYLVYENTAGALRAGEQVSIDDGDLHLPHVPVL